MKKIILTIVLVVLLSAPNAFCQKKKAGLGMEFGTTFSSYMKSNFETGGSNYFRLIMNEGSGVEYFLHAATGDISAEEGDATTTLSTDFQGIGANITGPYDVTLSLMVGSATVNGAAAAGTGTNAITALQSTSPFADIGFGWARSKGNFTLDLGLSYRYHTLSNSITFTDSAGSADRITDMSAINANIGIAYKF